MADPWYNVERVSQPGSVILRQWNADRQAKRQADAIVASARQSAARQSQPVAPKRQRGQRSFTGGLPSRLTANFVATNTSIDADLLAALDTMRARSRYLGANNPYAARYLRMCPANVVGAQGFTLQCRSSDTRLNGTGAVSVPDTIANRAIESGWAAWAQLGVCDITGLLSFDDICRVSVRNLAQDGEFLIRIVRGKAINRFGIALQLLDIDRLEVSDNRRLADGNIVRMGVELNPAGRPVAYWLRTTHPGDNSPAAHPGVVRERIPAEDVYHGYMPLRPEQRRGVPWMHSAIESLYHVGEFDQSVLVAARKGADTLGFFVSPDGQPPGADEDGEAPIEISAPGTFDTLPEGYDLRAYDSKYPSDVYGPFVKDHLRRVASGFNVSYNGLANDLEGVNFSSIRAGLLEEREFWMEVQGWFIGRILSPLYREWLRMALAMGAIAMENGSTLPATKYEKFAAHTWQGRRWPWVDPEKDINAAILAIGARLDSPQRIAAQQGRDVEDVLDDIAAFEAMAAAKNVSLFAAPPAEANLQTSQNQPT